MKGTVAREGGALHVAEAAAWAVPLAGAGAPSTDVERRRATRQEETVIMMKVVVVVGPCRSGWKNSSELVLKKVGIFWELLYEFQLS